jgi:hypothetical protein
VLRKLFAAVALLACSQGVQAAPADEVRQLVEQGRAAEAYQLGSQFPDELGSPDFDFYFGIAAIDADHAGEGVLALERYLVRFPENDRARLELARGYFALGDLLRARAEFQAVSSRKPPAGVQATIDQFIDAIRTRETVYKTSALAWLEAGLGTDSNVNGGVTDPSIILPIFGSVRVAGPGVKTGDNFTHLAGGAQLSQPVAPGIAVFGAVQADGKLNFTDSQFDQNNATASGGLSLLKGGDLYRATLGYTTTRLENDRFRDATSLNGEWSHQVDDLRSVNLFAQYAEFRYPGANQVRDADFYAVGGGVRQAFAVVLQPALQLQASFGHEENDRQRNDLSRDLAGLRAALSLSPAPRWGLVFGLSSQDSRYAEPDPLLQVTRKDRYLGADITASYLYTRNLSVRAELVYAKNASNLALFQYDRTVFAVKFRYEFK